MCRSPVPACMLFAMTRTKPLKLYMGSKVNALIYLTIMKAASRMVLLHNNRTETAGENMLFKWNPPFQSSSSQPLGCDPLEVKQPFKGVVYQIPYISDIYIRIPNSRKTAVTK